eukprot:GDKJ01013965.1.p1 GENE.GDKJ01013965.1~~GDKJ01013965.1.p1  ORF type:complete len:724 (-),score=144.43 GDKJ01013965.1:47-2218(-)
MLTSKYDDAHEWCRNVCNSRGSQVTSYSFNQDHSCLAVSTSLGFRIFSTDPLKELICRETKSSKTPGSLRHISILDRSSVFIMVRENQPNSVQFWDDQTCEFIGQSISVFEEITRIFYGNLVIVCTQFNISAFNPATCQFVTSISTLSNPNSVFALAPMPPLDPSGRGEWLLATPLMSQSHCVLLSFSFPSTSSTNIQTKKQMAIEAFRSDEIGGICFSGSSSRRDGLFCNFMSDENNEEVLKMAICNARSQVVRIFNAKTGNFLQEVRRGMSSATCGYLGFSNCGKWLLLSTCEKRTVHLFHFSELNDSAKKKEESPFCNSSLSSHVEVANVSSSPLPNDKKSQQQQNKKTRSDENSIQTLLYDDQDGSTSPLQVMSFSVISQQPQQQPEKSPTSGEYLSSKKGTPILSPPRDCPPSCPSTLILPPPAEGKKKKSSFVNTTKNNNNDHNNDHEQIEKQEQNVELQEKTAASVVVDQMLVPALSNLSNIVTDTIKQSISILSTTISTEKTKNSIELSAHPASSSSKASSIQQQPHSATFIHQLGNNKATLLLRLPPLSLLYSHPSPIPSATTAVATHLVQNTAKHVKQILDVQPSLSQFHYHYAKPLNTLAGLNQQSISSSVRVLKHPLPIILPPLLKYKTSAGNYSCDEEMCDARSDMWVRFAVFDVQGVSFSWEASHGEVTLGGEGGEMSVWFKKWANDSPEQNNDDKSQPEIEDGWLLVG